MEEIKQPLQSDPKKRALSEAGITYSLCPLLSGVLVLILALFIMAFSGGKEEGWYLTKDWYKYLGYLLPQLAFCACAVIFFLRSKTPVKTQLALPKWYDVVAALLLEFGLMFSLSALNGLFIELLKLMGYKEQMSTLPNLGGWNLLPAILVIAVLPALFEEVVFRGIITRQMQENGWGFWASVLVSGALFSLFHHNPEQTVYQFVCGVAFAVVALKTGSLIPTVAAHFMNNALILILSSAYAPSGENWSLTDVMPLGGYIALIIVSGLCLVGAALYFLLFRKKLVAETPCEGKGVKHGKLFFLTAAAGIGLSAVEWIVVLVTGFV